MRIEKTPEKTGAQPNKGFWSRWKGGREQATEAQITKFEELIAQARERAQSSSPDAARQALALYSVAIEKMLAAPPEDEEAWQILGTAYLERGQVQERLHDRAGALQSYLEARALLPEMPSSPLQFAAVSLASSGDSKQTSFDLYLDVVRTLRGQEAPEAVRPVYSFLEKHSALGENTASGGMQERLNLCLRVIDADPGLSWAHYYAGIAYFCRRRYIEASESFLQARALNCQKPFLDFYIDFVAGIQSLEEDEDFPQAVASFRRASDAAPHRADSQFGLGKAILERYFQQPTAVSKAEGVSAQRSEESEDNSLAIPSDSDSTEATADSPEANSLSEALACLELAVRRSPQNQEYTGYLGSAYRRLGRLADAIALFQRAAQAGGYRLHYLLCLGESLLEVGRGEEALIAAREALSLDAENPLARRLLGWVFLESRQFPKAADAFQAILDDAPEDREAQEGLGRALLGAGRYTEAIDLLTALPDRTEAADFALARAYALTDRFAQALESLTILIARQPANASYRYYQALALAHLGRDAESLTALEEAIRLDPMQEAYHRHRGHHLVRQAHFEEAEQTYRAALALRPSSREILLCLGKVLCLLGKEEDAQNTLQTALAEDFEDRDAHLALGALHEQAGRMDEALTAYAAAAGIAPKDSLIHRRIGVLQFRRKHFDTSARSLEMARTLGDESDESLYYLGLLGARREDYAATCRLWTALAQRHPDDARLALNLNRLHYLLGKQSVDRGDYENAISEWRRYLESRPEDEALQQEIATLCVLRAIAENDPPAALDALEQAIHLDPEHPHYRLCRAALEAEVPPLSQEAIAATLRENLRFRAMPLSPMARYDEVLTPIFSLQFEK